MSVMSGASGAVVSVKSVTLPGTSSVSLPVFPALSVTSTVTSWPNSISWEGIVTVAFPFSSVVPLAITLSS